jgi:UDP-N-acetyl-D-glucosamine dehydrogenase
MIKSMESLKQEPVVVSIPQTNQPDVKKLFAEQLESKINTNTAKIAVIGMGYVGLPLASYFAKKEFPVVGIEINSQKVESLKRGLNYVEDDKGLLKEVVEAGHLKATTDFSVLEESDVILICVPTPLNKYREPDMSHIQDSVDKILKYFRPGQLIILESTTYPGTTDGFILPLLEKTGLKVGEDFFLAFSPERVDPGNSKYHTGNTPKVVGGVEPVSGELSRLLYSKVIDEVHVATSARAAEMEKLYENIFRAVNIALVNEMALLCRRMGISMWEVIELAKTKPYGFMPFYPGPGMGGHCIPIDPFYLTWKAREFDFCTHFIELAGEINTDMPYEIVNIVAEALGSIEKPIKNSRVLLLGAAYKKDIGDLRESPALKIFKILKDKGAAVEYNDPYATEMRMDGQKILSVENPDLASYDCVVITTDHSCYDYDDVIEKSRVVVDTRNATKKFNNPKIFLL